jgi:hypothetical protein
VVDISDFLLSKLDKLDEKLDAVREQQLDTKLTLKGHIDSTQVINRNIERIHDQLDEYNQLLEEHIRRTKILEDKVEPIYNEYTEEQVVEKVKSSKIKKIGMIVGIIATLVGIAAGIAQILGML